MRKLRLPVGVRDVVTKMDKKENVYTPVASYANLKSAESAIVGSQTVDQLREALRRFGPQIGYKAFSYIFLDKLTPEAMKPDEAVTEAARMELQGDIHGAHDIYRRVLEVHPGHPIALAKMQDPADRLVSEIFQSIDRLPRSSN